MPRVVKMYEKSKASLVHNQGPSRPITRREVRPITRREVKKAGSLEKVYMEREKAGEPFATKVVNRMASPEVGFPSDLPIEAIPKKKKKPLLQRYGEKFISPKTKKGLKITPER